jgi:ABC-type multidrug transport system fused ATPase/permease subunit
MNFRRIYSVIPGNFHRSLVFVLVLMVFSMILETLSIGLVVPAISLLTQQDILINSELGRYILSMLGSPSESEIIIGGLLFLLFIYLVKSAFMSFYIWKQNDFAYSLLVKLSEELYFGYLCQPWPFHVKNNSAYLLRNVTTEVNLFINSVLIPALRLATEVLVLAGITILLLIIEPLGTICVMALLLFSGAIFQKLTKKQIIQWGEQRQLYEGKRIFQLQQGLASVKEIKLLGREDSFLNLYHPHNLLSSRAIQLKIFFQQLPRIFLEVFAVAGLTVLVVMLVFQGKNPTSFMPIIGLFGAAIFRLLPSANRIIESFQNLHYGAPSIEVLSDQITKVRSDSKSAEAVNQLTFENNITFDRVSFIYPETNKIILNDVCMSIPRGKSVGLVGGSGAGKTTLVDLLLGLLIPSKGSILVDGNDISKNLKGWQKNLGYVPQHINLLDDSLLRNITFGLDDEKVDDKKVQQAIEATQLENLVRELPGGIHSNIGEKGVKLSGGQRQRIGIARALYQNPELLVLDEATSALDTMTEKRVMDAIYKMEGQKTIIIIAHRYSTVDRCDAVYRLDNGCLKIEDLKTKKVAGS